jgi:DNA-cytosine methyltransferase
MTATSHEPGLSAGRPTSILPKVPALRVPARFAKTLLKELARINYTPQKYHKGCRLGGNIWDAPAPSTSDALPEAESKSEMEALADSDSAAETAAETAAGSGSDEGGKSQERSCNDGLKDDIVVIAKDKVFKFIQLTERAARALEKCVGANDERFRVDVDYFRDSSDRDHVTVEDTIVEETIADDSTQIQISHLRSDGASAGSDCDADPWRNYTSEGVPSDNLQSLLREREITVCWDVEKPEVTVVGGGNKQVYPTQFQKAIVDINTNNSVSSTGSSVSTTSSIPTEIQTSNCNETCSRSWRSNSKFSSEKRSSKDRSSKGCDFTFVELFAGIGGFRVGLEAIGGKCILASEFDEDASMIYRANFDPNFDVGKYLKRERGFNTQIGSRCLENDNCGEDCAAASRSQLLNSENISMRERLELDRDVRDISDAELEELRKLHGRNETDSMDSRSIDLLVGGFPCQPFSTLGAQPGTTDEDKGNLFLEICRFLKILKPKGFLLENVAGLLTANDGEDFRKIVACLEKPGSLSQHNKGEAESKQCSAEYSVSWQILNSKSVVAQKRNRVYIVGLRRDLCTENVPFDFPNVPDLGIVARDVMERDEQSENDNGVGEKNQSMKGEESQMNGEESQMNSGNMNSGNDTGTNQMTTNNDNPLPSSIHDPLLPYTLTNDQFSKLQKTKTWIKRGLRDVLIGGGQKVSTLVSHYGHQIHNGNSQLVARAAPLNPRRLTPRECARIQGFPCKSADSSQRPFKLSWWASDERLEEQGEEHSRKISRDFFEKRNSAKFSSFNFERDFRTHRGDVRGLPALERAQYRMVGNAVGPPMIAILGGAVIGAVKSVEASRRIEAIKSRQGDEKTRQVDQGGDHCQNLDCGELAKSNHSSDVDHRQTESRILTMWSDRGRTAALRLALGAVVDDGRRYEVRRRWESEGLICGKGMNTATGGG